MRNSLALRTAAVVGISFGAVGCGVEAGPGFEVLPSVSTDFDYSPAERGEQVQLEQPPTVTATTLWGVDLEPVAEELYQDEEVPLTEINVPAVVGEKATAERGTQAQDVTTTTIFYEGEYDPDNVPDNCKETLIEIPGSPGHFRIAIICT